MVTLKGSDSTTLQCSKCENKTVFITHEYKFFGLFYDRTVLRCEFRDCNYTKYLRLNHCKRKRLK